jgi:hypothetical protein
MDDPGCRSAAAVEPPRPRVELELGPRRHRILTAPSGLLLFVCLFLPAVKDCGNPVYPLQVPMFLPPYFYGLAFAFAAATLTARGMRNAIVAIRVVTLLTLAGSVVLLFLSPAVGIIELVISAFIFAGIDTNGHSEHRAAVAVTSVGAICTLWFGLWASTADALLGVDLSLCASIGLLVGGLVWLAETSHQPMPLIILPRAVARRPE